MKKRMLVGSLLLSFLVGVGLSLIISDQVDKSDNIPYGVYGPFMMMRGLSYQINLTQLSADKDTRTLTTWIREDREITFLGETGVKGQTIFTHLTINCKNDTVAILEQRGFDENMSHTGTVMGKGTMDSPISLVSISAIAMICGIPDPSMDHQRGHPFPLPAMPNLKAPHGPIITT